MPHQTLEELKAANAAAEEKNQAGQSEEDNQSQMQGEDDASEEHSPNADADEDSSNEEVPEWMQSDDQTSQATMPVKSHIRTKQKLKGAIREKDSEIDQLKQKIEALESGSKLKGQPDSSIPDVMPNPDDFLDDDNPQAAYAEAMEKWTDHKVEKRFQAHSQRQQEAQVTEQSNRALDAHYSRVQEEIIDKGLLSEDEYRDADTYMRRSVDAIAPGQGDAYVDGILSRLGEGSEKIVVALAKNASHMTQFQQALRDDPTGLQAMAFLGGLNARFGTASKRTSSAPRPGKQVKGDGGGKSSSSAKKAYDKAHAAGNRQEAFRLRRKAKAEGVDVSTW